MLLANARALRHRFSAILRPRVFYSSQYEQIHRSYSSQSRSSKQNYYSPYFLLAPTAAFLFFSTSSSNSNCRTFPGKVISIATGVFCASKLFNGFPSAKTICSPTGCGEDSWCVEAEEEFILLGVADGVGGWRDKGVNPADFSQNLMQNTGKAFQENSKDGGAKAVLKEAFNRLVKDWEQGRAKPFGSSTACVVLIDRRNGELNCANLGDSGVIVLSKTQHEYKVKFKSEIQQSRFNCPYQLTLTPPPKVAAKDVSDLAESRTLQLEKGDVVLVVTDGVLDNLFSEQLEEITNNLLLKEQANSKPESLPAILARRIGEEAYKNSKNEVWDSPFAVEARKHGRDGYKGGKTDDITVVSAIIY